MNQKSDQYRSLARHFSALCKLPISLVDSVEHEIRLTENAADNFFCETCPNRCNLLPTMLYGCSEARRWKGRYIYYCPIGLVFSAVTVPETDLTVLAGPVVMGELQDTLIDMPEHIDKGLISGLSIHSADTVNHITSLLEMAVCGLRYRPDKPNYDRNIISENESDPMENAEQYNSFAFFSEYEETLQLAREKQDKSMARSTLNRLLCYVYAPHPDQFAAIKSRAIQLLYLLMKILAGDSEKEPELYRTVYIPALKNTRTIEALDASMAEALYYFIDYSFDFTQIRHSDTIYRIMDFVKSNYGQKITLEDVAAHVYRSPSHISGVFRRETGQTISAYITYIRIEKSKLLLRQTAASILEVAQICGFEDQSYFTRVFKKEVGVSPRSYRENTGENTDAM